MHIYLIGYRGSGKSTVARELARRLGCPAIDTDLLIVQAAGKSIREIFAYEGEEKFRDREHAVIASVAADSKTKPAVVALGGGAILRDANRLLLTETGQCVWLAADPQLLYERICGDAQSADQRPNLSDSGGYREVESILAAREPIYRGLAQKSVNIGGKSPDEVVDEILLWAKSTA